MGIRTKTKNKDHHTTKRHSKHPRLLKWLLGIFGGLILLVLAIFLAFQLSPWPGALLIRYEFEKGGAKTSKALEKHVPAGVIEIQDQQYRMHDKDAYLDIFYPERVGSTKEQLPTVVWVHGGAWISGDKDEVDNYLKIIAARGYSVVGVNYSIAPEKQYPTPVLQVNAALAYLRQNAQRLHIDQGHFILAGDSAGSQIAAQVATIITNPDYAQEVNISSSLPAHRLKGIVLNCGAYDLALPHYDSVEGQFLKTVLWAYSGNKDFMHDKNIQHASVVDYVNKDFPPSFITAGNADPLEPQSREFAKKLTDLKVPTSTLFYPADHEPKLPHEYQFDLDTTDGKKSLQRILDFLKTH